MLLDGIENAKDVLLRPIFFVDGVDGEHQLENRRLHGLGEEAHLV